MRNAPRRAFTVIELLVIVFSLVLLFAILFPSFLRARQRARRITCTNYLMQIGLAFKTWSLDHTNQFPMQVSSTNGGSLEFVSSGAVFPHFEVMSNELATPYVLACPADSRKPARAFSGSLSNSNVSYFVNVDADDSKPSVVLAGDRNLTNGVPPEHGLLRLLSGRAAGWTPELHHGLCQILLVDGSVAQAGGIWFSNILTDSIGHRLAIP